MKIEMIDLKIINFFKRSFEPMARFGLFVVFFWFGILKVIGFSPASEVMQKLFETTIPFLSFDVFVVGFGLFECVIGVMFLIRGLERVVIPLLFIHMITTFGPLVFLPSETWQKFLVPTLEGQYIIKNLVIIATGIGIAAKLDPIKIK
jgi:uncharacterized membrane protein YkgB